MAADFLVALLAANLAAGAAIVLVLILREPVRRIAGARLGYWLWLTPIAAGIAVLLPALPAGVAPGAPIRPMMESAFVSASGWVTPNVAAPSPSAAAQTSVIDLSIVGVALWAAGAAAFLGLMLWRQLRGAAQFGRLTPTSAGIWRASGQAGPAVMGLLRPRLVAPADFEVRFTEREQKLVLAHERVHLEAGHTRVNAVLAMLACINWFNPLVHLGVRCARTDQELACDAAVVERFPGERRIYAEALLKTQLAPASLPLGCTWPPRSSSLLKERVMMLARKSPGRLPRIAGAVLISAIASGAALAGWAQKPPPAPSGAPMVAPADPRTMTDEEAWKTLQRLREPDGGPPGVAPADLKLIRAQLEERFKNGGQIPVAAPVASLDRDAMLKAVQSQPIPARIAGVKFTCDVWTAKYSNLESPNFDWNKFNDKAAVILSIDGDSKPTVTIPDNAFPAGTFPVHGKIAANNRYIDTNSISYRLMSDTLIDSLTFIELDKQMAKVKWERIKLGNQGPRETFLNGYCRR